VWKAVELERRPSVVINEPAEGEEVEEKAPADWRGVNEGIHKAATKKLGLRPDDDDSRSVSRAGSMRSHKTSEFNDSAEELKGVKSDVNPDGDDSDVAQQEESISKEPSAVKKSNTSPELSSHNNDSSNTPSQVQVDGEAGLVSGLKHLSTGDLPDGVPEMELKEHSNHAVGQLIKAKNDETVS
jgi:hypothetical protein